MSKIKICLDAGHVGSKYNQSPVVKTYYESAMVWKLHLLWRSTAHRTKTLASSPCSHSSRTATITITVTDGKGGTAYRRLTFKRTNSAPAISGADTDLGLKTGSFAENYTITDVEGDNVVVTEFVDDDEIRSYQATLGEEATIELTREKWLTLANGTHQLRVEAVDGNFATSVRAWIFSKAENTIAFQFSAPEETDARATKILITPTWKIEGAVAKVEACNNAFDAVPTWEDITAMVQLNRVFNFTNETKTADKWGVNVRFTIVKNEGYEGEVSISGFGGAYE